mgnify:FL=1
MTEVIKSLMRDASIKRVVIVAAVLTLLAAAMFIKKAIKLALILLLVAFITLYGAKMLNSVKQKAGIMLEEGILHIDNEFIGNYEIDLNIVENIIIKDSDNKENVVVDITTKGKRQAIEIPEKYLWIFQDALNKAKVGIVDLRSSK